MPSSPSSEAHTRACDACKARKVRCIRSNPSPSSSSSGQLAPCDHCTRRGERCTIDVPLKKRGPAPQPRFGDKRRLVPLASKARDDMGSVESAEKGSPTLDSPPDSRYSSVNGGIHRGLPYTTVSEHRHEINGTTSLESKPPTLDQIIPRSLLEHAITVYFEYVYGLVPIVHRPSFLSDFHNRRDVLPGEEEWAITLLGVAALTMAQVPWAFKPLEKEAVKEILRLMYERIKSFVFRDEGEVNLAGCCMLYMLVIVSTRLGHWGIREICLGACWRFIFDERLHEEASYKDKNAIEAELGRRLYWLALGFDKASAAGRATVPMITRETCATVNLPTAIDDDYLNFEGYITPPNPETSILSGFRYISKLYDVFGKVLDSRRMDQLKPPSGIMLDFKIAEVEEYYEQIHHVLDGCPPELKLRDPTSSPLGGVLDWAGDALEAIRQILAEPEKKIPDAFLVQQGNIWTAYHMARQLTMRYRADLATLRLKEAAHLPLVPGMSNALETESLERMTDQTAADLLHLLKVLPLDVLSVNGDAVVNKVRYVALSQLDALIDLGERQDQLDHDQVQKLNMAQNHLREFLSILAHIEQLYSLIDPNEIRP